MCVIDICVCLYNVCWRYFFSFGRRFLSNFFSCVTFVILNFVESALKYYSLYRYIQGELKRENTHFEQKRNIWMTIRKQSTVRRKSVNERERETYTHTHVIHVMNMNTRKIGWAFFFSFIEGPLNTRSDASRCLRVSVRKRSTLEVSMYTCNLWMCGWANCVCRKRCVIFWARNCHCRKHDMEIV